MKKYTHFITVLDTLSFLFLLLIFMAAVFFLPEEFFLQIERSDSIKVFSSSSDLLNYYAKNETSLTKTIETEKVPRIFSENLPQDLSKQPSKVKTPLFISLVLTNALKANEAILHVRKRLLYLQQQELFGHNRSLHDKKWLEILAGQYSTTTDISLLLKRVDVIPVSLAIAQAITESGWGSSRFAHNGNALYGQHLSKSSFGKFILSHSGNIKVAAFDSIYSSTQSYMHNLNTSKAYSSFRKIRHDLRSKQQPIDGYTLAEGLLHYSAQGTKYIDTIRLIILHYKLSSLDNVVFTKNSPAITVRFLSPTG